MIYNFSRQQAQWPDVSYIKQVTDSVKYVVSNQEGDKCGEFLYNPKWCCILYGDKRVRFDIKRPWIGDDTVIMADDITNEVIGSFDRETHWLRKHLWDGFSFYNKYYKFKSLKSGVKASISKWTNHNHLKFSLANATEEFIYTFKIDLPVFSWGDRIKKCQFEGTIQSDASDLVPLFAGFFLIEETLREIEKTD